MKCTEETYDIFSILETIKKSIKMKKKFFQILAKLNKRFLPSFTKKGIQLEEASKLQLALFAYRMWVTKNALN